MTEGRLTGKTAERLASVIATLRLVADPALEAVSGPFFDGLREAEPDPQAADPAARRSLEAASAALAGQWLTA